MYARSTVPALHFSLDAPLPARLAVGGGAAVFVSGYLFCPTNRIRALAIVVDGDPQPRRGCRAWISSASVPPRLDPYALSGLRPRPRLGRRPGASCARLSAVASRGWRRFRGSATCALQAGLEGGGAAVAELASIEHTSLDRAGRLER